MPARIRYRFYLLLILSSLGLTGFAQEICDNGIDDDSDGLTDLYDPQCQCHFTVAGNLLQNASFEEYNRCASNFTYQGDYNLIKEWQYGSFTKQVEYYHQFNCVYDSSIVMLHMPPALPLPDGKAFVAITNIPYLRPVPPMDLVKSYIGQCLQAPLVRGEAYTLSFYAGTFRSWDNYLNRLLPFTVALYGNADCNAVPFGKMNVAGNGCPANYPGWVLLGSTKIFSSGSWVQAQINFTVPGTVNVIEVGSECEMLPEIVDQADSTTFLDYHTFYLDDLHLLPTKDFPFQYISVKAGTGCSNGSPVLVAPDFAGASYQWYRDSIALVGATARNYQVPHLAETTHYNVMIMLPGKCIASETFTASPDGLEKIQLPADTLLCGNERIRIAGAVDGITYRYNGLTDTMVSIDQPGIYNIVATNTYGCERSFTLNVARQNCTDCEVFMPSAFTPNNDGLNDKLLSRTYCSLSEFDLVIFNRWGQRIFESHNYKEAWDGTYLGKKMPVGVYAYFIRYKTSNKLLRVSRGLITLIR
jgi:gliding motility-associated-like protein